MSLVAALILLAVIALVIGVSLRGPRAGRGHSSGDGGVDHSPWYAFGLFGSGSGSGSGDGGGWGGGGGGGGGFDGGGGGGGDGGG